MRERVLIQGYPSIQIGDARSESFNIECVGG
jgi:hypothetical protein